MAADMTQLYAELRNLIKSEKEFARVDSALRMMIHATTEDAYDRGYEAGRDDCEDDFADDDYDDDYDDDDDYDEGDL